MIRYRSVSDMITDSPNCPVCDKAMTKVFATGDYNKLTYNGIDGHTNTFRLTKAKLTVTRLLKVDDVDISCDYTMKTDGMEFKTKLNPSEDELIEKFPVVRSFYELEGTKYEYAQNTGLINIWRIVKRLQSSFYFHQICEEHFKRMFIMEIDENEEKFSEIWNYDEFYLVPNAKDPETKFMVHDHRSPITKKERVVFIQRVEEKNSWKMDPKAGGVWLYERKDGDLMNFEFKDLERMSRRLNTLYGLRSG